MTAYLVSGDYDLREGVVAAQDLGVQVYLMGFQTDNPTVATLAPALIREVDGFEEFGEDFVAPYFTEIVEEEHPSDPTDFGRQFAHRWIEQADEDAIRKVIESKPRIPSDVDGHLLSEADRAFGDLRDREPIRHDLRTGFWSGIEEE